MTLSAGEGDVARLILSFGLRGFRYRSFGNRAVRLVPEVAPPAETATVIPPEEPVPGRGPDPVLAVPPPVMALPLPLAPLPRLTVAGAPRR
ncbi:hypothetical protein ACFQU2_25855 [Siccirubricoccus deserti]